MVKALPFIQIQKNRQPNQQNRNDPEHNVFTALFFVRHKGSTAYLKSSFKYRLEFIG